MTVSSAIALVVGIAIIVACGSLFLGTLILGKVEGSGYTIDWKSNPIQMTIWLLSTAICPILIVWGFATHWHGGSRASATYHVYVDVRPEMGPGWFNYEGPGVVRPRGISRNEAGGFEFDFSAMSLPDGLAWRLDGLNDLPKYRVFDFTGRIVESDGKWRLQGELLSRDRGELHVDGAGDPIELRPGRNPVSLEWVPRNDQ